MTDPPVRHRKPITHATTAIFGIDDDTHDSQPTLIGMGWQVGQWLARDEADAYNDCFTALARELARRLNLPFMEEGSAIVKRGRRRFRPPYWHGFAGVVRHMRIADVSWLNHTDHYHGSELWLYVRALNLGLDLAVGIVR